MGESNDETQRPPLDEKELRVSPATTKTTTSFLLQCLTCSKPNTFAVTHCEFLLLPFQPGTEEHHLGTACGRSLSDAVAIAAPRCCLFCG